MIEPPKASCVVSAKAQRGKERAREPSKKKKPKRAKKREKKARRPESEKCSFTLSSSFIFLLGRRCDQPSFLFLFLFLLV